MAAAELDALISELFQHAGQQIRLTADLPGLEVAEANRDDPDALGHLLRAQREHWLQAQEAFNLGVDLIDRVLELLESGSAD